TLKEDFRHINPEETQVILVEMVDRVLPPFPEDLSAQARRSLEKLGVTVRTGVRVKEITESAVVVIGEDGAEERIPCYTAMWAAGVRASGLGKVLHERTGVELDRGGRVKVAPDLSIPDYPEIFVVGDMVHFVEGDKPLPGV